MPAYINVSDIETRTGKKFSADEKKRVELMISQAGTLIDSYNCDAPFDAKQMVSNNIVTRLLAAEEAQIPMGVTQGSFSGLGYSQAYTFGSGTGNGEMYLTKADKHMLRVSDRIGASNPLGALVGRCWYEG